jgi:hypothetical protein
MRRFKRYRLLCKDKMFKIMSALHKARSVAGQLGQRITLQERSHRLASDGNGGYYIGICNGLVVVQIE